MIIQNLERGICHAYWSEMQLPGQAQDLMGKFKWTKTGTHFEKLKVVLKIL